jgi:hypothetical protein
VIVSENNVHDVLKENQSVLNEDLDKINSNNKFAIENQDISFLADVFSEPAFETLYQVISLSKSLN